MTSDEIFTAWAPEGSVWSNWVKPVLFAHLGTAPDSSTRHANEVSVDWAPAVEEKFALVLDLPKDTGVWVGLELAASGYQPVPLYNALPLPFGVPNFDTVSQRPVAAVDVQPILAALRHGAQQLVPLDIPTEAPPAFLLDANRQALNVVLQPDEFDNRSICFTTDFPSANYLLTHGIERALLVQQEREEPQTDLAHVLRRWQDGGLRLERIGIKPPTEREPFEVERPAWYGMMFQRALASFGLRRARGGGFGGWIPESPGGG